jgi:hypothetical protein
MSRDDVLNWRCTSRTAVKIGIAVLEPIVAGILMRQLVENVAPVVVSEMASARFVPSTYAHMIFPEWTLT